ncbi:hypothetical protein STEG23_024197, partial [Scotinomys teguina]
QKNLKSDLWYCSVIYSLLRVLGDYSTVLCFLRQQLLATTPNHHIIQFAEEPKDIQYLGYLTTFEALNIHKWLLAPMLDSADAHYFCHCKKQDSVFSEWARLPSASWLTILIYSGLAMGENHHRTEFKKVKCGEKEADENANCVGVPLWSQVLC